MITYTEEDVEALGFEIKVSQAAIYPAIHVARELARGFRYGHEVPYIISDSSGYSYGFFVQQVEFKNVPLFLNDKKLRILAEWRLRIGK